MPIRRSLKNVVKNYSNSEIKVREATSNDPWGPSSTLMSEIAGLTYNVIAFNDIMEMLWRRINDHGKNWRHVYKALVLLEYIVKTGSERVASQCISRIYDIQTLKDFQFLEEQKDHGLNVREKAKSLIALLTDEERLKTEREKALKAKQRFAKNSSAISSTGVVVHATGSTMSHIEETIDPALTEELEAVRPSTQGEEELQLALALAMSKEEHDFELKQKRGDDMKLAMAIEESNKPTPSPSNVWPVLADANPTQDPWAASTSGAGTSASTSTSLPLTGNHDPWSTSNDLPQPAVNDPWSAMPSTATMPTPAPVSSANDEFDLLSTRSTVDVVATEPGNYLLDMGDLLTVMPATSEPVVSKKENKPVSSFLGDNASLVNLDHLITTPVAPQQNFMAASLNPFSNQSILCNPTSSTGITRNPFASQQNAAKGLSMNAMISNSHSNQFNGQNNTINASTLPEPLLPMSSTNTPANNNPFL